MNGPSIYIVIATHGRPTLLRRTLDSVTQCELPDDAYQELIVIENGSQDGAERLVGELPDRLNARYMHREWGNKSHALNEALETVGDGFVVFFDDDVQVHANALVAYAEAAQKHGRGHFFGGPVEVDRKKAVPEWMEDCLLYSAKGYDLIETRWEGKYLGHNWAAFANDVRQIGGFNTDLGPGAPTGTNVGDESELQDRLLDEGYTGIDVMQATVTHHVPTEAISFRYLVCRRFYLGIADVIRKTEGDPFQELVSNVKDVVLNVARLLRDLALGRKKGAAVLLLRVAQSSGRAKQLWKSISWGKPTG